MRKIILVIILIILGNVKTTAEELPREVTRYEPLGDKCVIFDSVRKMLFLGAIDSGTVGKIADGVTDFSISPDGKRVVYNVQVGTGTAGQIWLFDVEKADTLKISDEFGQNFKWGNGDGRVFYCPAQNQDRLIIIDRAGGKKIIQLK